MRPIRITLVAALLSGALWPASAADNEAGGWVVATITRSGAWGVGSGERQAVALTAALRDCRAKANAPSECGAQTASARKGWILAFRCGEPLILVADTELSEAQAAAARRIADLSEEYDADLPSCRPILVVDPDGIATAILPDVAAN